VEAEVFLSNALVFFLLGKIPARLCAMSGAEDRAKIAFPVLTAVDQCDFMIAIPLIACSNFLARFLTNPVEALENTELDPWRNRSVVRFADPFLGRSAH
jgi:hypothetical protein